VAGKRQTKLGKFKSSVAVAAAALALVGAGMAHADGPAGERDFIAHVRQNLASYAIPNGLYALDPEVIGYGYEACRALDNHPEDADVAKQQFYGRYGYPPQQTARDPGQTEFMIYSAEFLCFRNFRMYGDGDQG
jgi:hypothetical protein